ncbi:Haloacid dehalogenase-like hydrolase domain-containing protein 3 [Dispira parvispora]|uniref:Haloacid dehalogenase-like hydrolase domain-containing protein 3 n=1 Tax=Dispira parvispora TaxID=1520584 RepID=A0A9W8AR67_9FUNG|nr:Haloacid dehalogenase-like hydrolase domain-containing protein 3 [Dispira parvispora]
MSCRTWWEKVILDTFHCAGITGVDQKQLQRVCTILYEKFATPEPYRVYPESQDTLLALAQRGIKLGIISNSDDRTEHLIKELGLGSYMDFIIISALEGIEKPSHGIFEKALRLAGTSPQQALHVGDDYQNDYQGPILVGMHALLIDRKANTSSCNSTKDSPLCISNLTQVLDWV